MENNIISANSINLIVETEEGETNVSIDLSNIVDAATLKALFMADAPISDNEGFRDSRTLVQWFEPLRLGRAKMYTAVYELMNSTDENVAWGKPDVTKIGNTAMYSRTMRDLHTGRFFRASVLSNEHGRAFSLDTKPTLKSAWRAAFAGLPMSGLSVYAYNGRWHFKTINEHGYAENTDRQNWFSTFKNLPGSRRHQAAPADQRAEYNARIGRDVADTGLNVREWSSSLEDIPASVMGKLNQTWTQWHFLAVLLADKDAFWNVAPVNVQLAEALYNDGVMQADCELNGEGASWDFISTHTEWDNTAQPVAEKKAPVKKAAAPATAPVAPTPAPTNGIADRAVKKAARKAPAKAATQQAIKAISKMNHYDRMAFMQFVSDFTGDYLPEHFSIMADIIVAENDAAEKANG